MLFTFTLKYLSVLHYVGGSMSLINVYSVYYICV